MPGGSEWQIFETGKRTRDDKGVILEVHFRAKYRDLPRIQIECDMVTDAMDDGADSLYRHVFSEDGCDDVKFPAQLSFTSNSGSSIGAKWPPRGIGVHLLRL